MASLAYRASARRLEAHHRHTLAALVAGRALVVLDQRVALQRIVDGPAQRAGAFAVHDAHPGQPGEVRLIDVLLDTRQRLVTRHADEVQFQARAFHLRALHAAHAALGFGLALLLAPDELHRVRRDLHAEGADLHLDLTVAHTEHLTLGVQRGHKHPDRKSTRLNSSHVKISYAVFC